MPYFTIVLASGRELQGSLPFNAGAIDEPIERIYIDHPQCKDTLEGNAHYFVFNEAMVVMGLGKRYAVNIGYINDSTAKGYAITESYCFPKTFDLSTFHPQTLEQMFKKGRTHIAVMAPEVSDPGNV
jgi:hypothetical protein